MLIRRSPRTVLAWAGAVAVALVTAQVVGSDLAAIHRRARASGPEVDVVVARRDLRLGATVQRDDLTRRRLYEDRLPPGAVRETGTAVGRIVSTPVLEGAIVTERHLARRDRDGIDGVVPPGMRAVRVVVDDGLRPEPGSVVDVLVSFDPSLVGDEYEPTMAVVRGALVVGSDPMSDLAGVDDDRGGVTVLTDPDGARRLAFAAANGIVTLTLAPPEEACCPTPPSTSSSDSSKD